MDNRITLYPDAARFGGTVPAIASKSYAHRLLFLASMSSEPCRIICSTTSKDIEATIRCMTALSADIRREGDTLFVTPISNFGAAQTAVLGSAVSSAASGNAMLSSASAGNAVSSAASAGSAAQTASENDLPDFCQDPAHKENNTQPVRMDAGESGSTLRFLLPLLGVLGRDAVIETGGRLASRPLSPLKEEMLRHGTKITVHLSADQDIETLQRTDQRYADRKHADQQDAPMQNPDYILTSGRLTGGTYTIAGNISSQYITGLLMALPLAEEDSLLQITGKLESKPYVDITLACLKEFGIRIDPITPGPAAASFVSNSGDQITETRFPAEASDGTAGEKEAVTLAFRIPGRQRPSLRKSPDAACTLPSCRVEGDWSNAAFFLVAGALSEQGVTVTGLRPDSCQGDKQILEVLQRFGAKVRITPADPSLSVTESDPLPSVTIKKASMRGLEIDAADIPDLVPVLSAAAAAAEGTTVFRNIERLRIKESDRVATVIDCLTSLGACAREENGCLIINGRGRISGGTADSHNDHRIAMTAAVLSLIAEEPVTITGASAVEKSYPGFYTDFRRLMQEELPGAAAASYSDPLS